MNSLVISFEGVLGTIVTSCISLHNEAKQGQIMSFPAWRYRILHLLISYIHIAVQRTQDKAGHNVLNTYIRLCDRSCIHSSYKKWIYTFDNPISFKNEPFSVVFVPF